MISVILVLAFGAASFVIPRRVLSSHGREGDRFAMLMLAGFVLRLLAHGVIRNVALFSHGGPSEGDASIYQSAAGVVAQIWDYHGISWLTADDIGVDGAAQALLAVHIYGALGFLNGGEVPQVGCVALNALLAALTCLSLVQLGELIGGRPRDCRTVALVMYFSPAFVFHTSDLFKDGISAFLVVSAVLIAFRLSRRFNPIDAALGVVCLCLLWFVRYYLVFLVTAPLVLSLLGRGSRTATRGLVLGLGIIAAIIILVATRAADDIVESGQRTFAVATADDTLAWNAEGGSGVTFGGGWLSLPLKILYTLFSPFPWDFRSTSIGFQVGKIDSVIWMFFLYRGVRGARNLWREDRQSLMMFLVVLVPLVFAYSQTMANIGLIVRQRIPIVMLGSVLAVRGWPVRRAVTQTARSAAAAVTALRRAAPATPRIRAG